MDLALALGGATLAEWDERMSEGEFRLWDKYARVYLLPQRSQQLQAAATARMIGMTMGGVKNSSSLHDFVILPRQPEDDTVNAEIGSAIVSAATSARVYRLGQGRKNKG